VNDQERTSEEELEHWRSELARVLKAAPDLTWSNLIDWAEEAEHFALKACTKSGRARLAGLDTRVTELEAEVARLTRELQQARRAKLNEAQPRLAAMEKLAAVWQKEAEHARKDLASQAFPDDHVEFIVWSALDGPLDEFDVRAVIKTLRNCQVLAAEALHVCADTWKDAEKRIRGLHTPVQHMGQTWCAECSVRRSTGPHSDEWVVYIPHPCPTLDALENKEPTA
jgi:hypothetical protein